MTRLRKRTTRRTPLCGWLIPDCLWSRLLADAFKSPLSGHTASFCLVRERLQHSTSFSSLAVAVLVEASMPHSVHFVAQYRKRQDLWEMCLLVSSAVRASVKFLHKPDGLAGHG